MSPQESDFFDSLYGYRTGVWRLKGRALDLLHDVALRLNCSYHSVDGKAGTHPVRRVLLIGVEVPGRHNDLASVMEQLSKSRHQVTCIKAPMLPDCGKFQNINAALAGMQLDEFDWLIVTDDDIAFVPGFLDRFTYLSEMAELAVCMPAHRFRSFQSFELTTRKWNSLVRLTNFVESGPLTAFSRAVFPLVLPFADLRWAWGTDIAWSEAARLNGYRTGIVDGTPIKHLRPVGGSYDRGLAKEEARNFLASKGVGASREMILHPGTVLKASFF